MQYAIVYSSRTGNTKLLAETVRQTLEGQGDCLWFGAPDDAALAAERIYVGFWTDQGSCDGETAAFLAKLRGQEVFLFGTAGFGGAPGYYDAIFGRVKALLPEGVSVKGQFLCQGKMPMAVRQRYERFRAAGETADRFDMLIENFDRALSHPDEQDLAALKAAVQSC